MSSLHSLASRSTRFVSLAVFVAVAASCGGGGDDGGTTAPGRVVRVDITAPTTSIEVGQNMQVTVRYFDGTNAQLSGKSITYSTSNSAVATVSFGGLVTGVTAGPVTITATVDGVPGTLQLTITPQPVFFVSITPLNPSVKQGETVTLSAQPQNATGQPITGKTITWASANPSRATITQGGVVTGVTPGTVYIRATADTRTDSISLRVRNLITPAITGTSSTTLVPGGTGSLTGTNFGAAIADNEVILNGVPVLITSASSTSVSFTVPSKNALPCSATGPVPVLLVANGDTASAMMQLRVATDRSLSVGQSLLLTADADLVCNEFTGTGGKYLITAFNHASSAATRTSFRLTGSGQGTASAVAANVPAPLAPRMFMPDDAGSRHLRAHAKFMQLDRQMLTQLGNPRVMQRKRARSLQGAAAANIASATVPPPAVGEQLTFRLRKTLDESETYDEVTFKVVYSGTKMVILEDVGSPLAGTMDPEYVKLGQEFDQKMYGQLLAFGDPLVVDSALDNNGRLLALFTPRVNGYKLSGLTNQILGFVTLCDFFPRVNFTLPDGSPSGECKSSNEGEAFYAAVPDPGAGWDLVLWRRLMRGTLIHEAKHIASYAWRYYYEASQLEEVWLEEATAQQASEIWARDMYGKGIKQDIRWADGPRCDYAAPGGACQDPAEGILHHFQFLYDHYADAESKSILYDPALPLDPVIYGSAWSFMRYVTDAYGTSEGDFLSKIVKVQNDRGVDNVVTKSGKPFSELFGMFSLASSVDNYPGANLADPKLSLASWHSRDLFQNMSANLVRGGEPAFPLPWPLQVRQVTFGNFTAAQSDVSQLRGGSWATWELSGAQMGPQALAIRSLTGGPAPTNIGMTIVRIQ